ncbi:MAG: hypothetical protein P8L68_06520 [Paracoccaceae bacterium]|nr:hypothetical protein [Paracoccaceae bacterium]MDG1739620.1 hypothetical protein [Paracoccaceae bacterium]MDG2258128.1 hypothetical protein [Paracoccaceae bacterium]
MDTPQTVPELIVAAQDNAKVLQNTILGVQEQSNGQSATPNLAKEFHEATVALKLAAIDAFTLFEARMQNHFKRGPFSRKLEAALLKAGHSDLAARIHEYYLVINVLKHGTGASYRELRSTSGEFFKVNATDSIDPDDDHISLSHVDIDVPGFFDGLTTTLLEAHEFLEN